MKTIVILLLLCCISCTEETLTIPDDVITDADGNIYHPVTIGTQTWLQENLRTTHYNDGLVIPNITLSEDWVDLLSPAYCWYFNIIDNNTPKGALYNWYAVNTGKLCPAGWHVSTDHDWKVLEFYLGIDSHSLDDLSSWRGIGIATRLMSISVWVDPIGTDDYTFNAYPAGFRYYSSGTFEYLGLQTDWWCADEYNNTQAMRRSISVFQTDGIYRGPCPKNNGISVRCVKD